MTNETEGGRRAALITHVVAVVGGLAGLTIWWLIFSHVSSTLTRGTAEELADSQAFVALLVASALAFILILGVGCQWIGEWISGLGARR